MLKILHLTDTHLFSDTQHILLGVNTEESFLAVLNVLQQEHEANFLIHSGDMSQDKSEHSYIRLAQALQSLNIPVYYIPGNHDDMQIIDKVYPYANMRNDKHILLSKWQFILLNSHKPGAVEGYLDASQLLYLNKCLQQHPIQYAAIFLHHQPIPVGSQWLDKLGVTNADAFWQVICGHPQVKAIFFGHVHQESDQIINGIPCYSTPSTCIQFKRQQQHFGLEELPPGYRWIHFHPNGELETGVQRTLHYIGSFDVNAKGY